MERKIVEGEKHFTASVWIVTNSTPKKMLLLHHKKLGKWLQPGGHIEQFENPLDTAIREVKEETGLDVSFLRDTVEVVDEEGTFLPPPQFVIEQTIPARKDEPMHYHIDINYVAEIPEQALSYREKESHGIGWFTKEEALQLPIHGDTRMIIEKLLS